MKFVDQKVVVSVAILLASNGVTLSAAEPKSAQQPSNHQDLGYYVTADGNRRPITSADDWKVRRRQILEGMQQAMGPLPRPAKPEPLDVQVVEEHRADGLIRRKIEYHSDSPVEVVRSWLLMADERSTKSQPAILCLHQTNTQGKDSPVGVSDRPTLHYALELARRGYVTLSPDYPSFGEHKHDFDADDYESGSMKAIYDNMRAIDVLQSLREVDGERIGCIGHSLGGHNSLFTAVFDERIKAVVTSCGFTAFHKYMGGDLHGWSSARYMPRIATEYDFSPDRMPFDFHEVLAAIAPRAVFIVAPLHDDNFDVAGVRECVEAARPIYKLLGHADRLQAVYPDAAHDFPQQEREQAYAFFDRAFNR